MKTKTDEDLEIGKEAWEILMEHADIMDCPSVKQTNKAFDHIARKVREQESKRVFKSVDTLLNRASLSINYVDDTLIAYTILKEEWDKHIKKGD